MRYAVYGLRGCLLTTNDQDEVANFIMSHSLPRILSIIDNGVCIKAERWMSDYDPILILRK